MSKCGTKRTHCCWFKGVECKHLERSTHPGFVWSCSLRRELGSWDKVHNDPRYLEDVKSKMEIACKGIDCGDWPPENIKCGDCGEDG